MTGGVKSGPGSTRGSSGGGVNEGDDGSVRAALSARALAASDREIVPSASSSSQVTVSFQSSSLMFLNGNFSFAGGLGPGLTSSQSSSKNLSSYPVAAHSFSMSRTQLFSGATTWLPSMSRTRPCSSRGNSRNSPSFPSPCCDDCEDEEDASGLMARVNTVRRCRR